MPGERSRGFAFGNFRLYPEEALLLRSGEPVALPPKIFKMLCVLVQNNGHLVEKEALLSAVWPDTHVVDNNLRYNISLLRKALSEDGQTQNFIHTYPTRGYKFEGELWEINEPPNLHTPELPGNGLEPAKGEAQAVAPRHQPSDFPFRWTRRVGAIAAVLVLLAVALAFLVRFRDRPVSKASASSEPIGTHRALSKNAEANEYFQRGVHALDRRSPSSGPKGVDALRHAVAIDPNFALAHAQLAVAYLMHGDAGFAGEAARKALSLDEALPEAHASLGFIAAYRDWDWKTAERELRRSIQLDPGYARGHQWLGNVYEIQGKLPEAQREMEAALREDPQSPIVNSDLCELLFFRQQYDAAIDQCGKTRDIDPDFVLVFGPLEAAYLAEKNYPAAADVAVRKALKRGEDPQFPNQLRTAFRGSGIRGLLRVEAQQLTQSSDPPAYFVARAELRLGKKERAVQMLLRAFHDRDFFLPYLACDPEFAPLRSDPRVQDILHRLGLS